MVVATVQCSGPWYRFLRQLPGDGRSIALRDGRPQFGSPRLNSSPPIELPRKMPATNSAGIWAAFRIGIITGPIAIRRAGLTDDRHIDKEPNQHRPRRAGCAPSTSGRTSKRTRC